MRHLLLLVLFLTTLRAGEAPRWAQMDYGPALGCSLQIGTEYVLRALIVRLDEEKQTHVAYDLETMRVAALWTGGFIDGKGVVFNGEHHVQPKPAGTMLWSNPVGPGWANKDGSFVDPRPQYVAKYNVPQGGSELTREGQPMPKEWVRYRGYHLHGQQVVLSYVINGCAVRERPALTPAGGFMRVVTIDPSTREQQIHLAASGAWWCAPDPDSDPGEVRLVDGQRVVVIPPHTRPRTFVVGNGSADQHDAAIAAITAAAQPKQPTTGGPQRWPQTITTQVSPGTGDGPHVVDTLTAPDANPWRSWLRFGGVDFFPDGKRAALCTWSGDVWIVSGLDGTTLTWKRYATGLHEPLGLEITEGGIVLTCRNAIMRLHDLDHDGEADFYEAFNTDIHLTRQFHEFALDLKRDQAGNFYFAKGATPGRGGPDFDLWSLHNGCFLRLSPDGKQLDVIARGLRAPNGIGIGPNGEMTTGDNQGSWVPVCPLNRIRDGAFVGIPDGVPGEVKPTKRDPPIIWLPMEVDNSSGCQVWVPDGRWGPFAGRMLHLSYGKSSLFSVMTQEVGDVMQGAVTRFPLRFATGIMRARFNPADGQLYVCGLRGWQTNGARDGAFQRVRYVGKPVVMAMGYAVTKDGIDLTFSQPLDRTEAENVENWSLQQFNVRWSTKYGSPEFSVADPTKHARDPVTVAKAMLKPDGKTVSLTIPGITPVNCLVIRPRIATADGVAITAPINATINVVP
jgi:glucose/arabinose dehydrogenase